MSPTVHMIMIGAAIVTSLASITISVLTMRLTRAERQWTALYSPCAHDLVRCVHGDEINSRNGARAACVTCDRSLIGRNLPQRCSVTGHLHPGSA